MRLIVVPLIAVIAAAQPAPSNKEAVDERRAVAERLAASDPADLAWGATLAANYHQSDFVPRIIELLNSPDRFVPYYAFDALIRLNASVQESTLVPLALTYFEPVMILLSLEPNKHSRVYMQLLDNAHNDLEWLVLSGLLFQSGPREFRERFLNDWTLKAEVHVIDPGIGFGHSEGDFACNENAPARAPQGFPPVPYYFIYEAIQTRVSAPGLVSGSYPLSYSTVPKLCKNHVRYTRDEYRFYLLSPITTGATPSRKRTIVFVDSAQYLREMEIYRAELRAFANGIRSELIGRQFIPEDRLTPPKIEILVEDGRWRASALLPDVDSTKIVMVP